MMMPTGWTEAYVSNTDTPTYSLFTPFPTNSTLGDVAGISVTNFADLAATETPGAVSYATLSGAVVELSREHYHILSEKNHTTLGTLDGYEIEFTENDPATPAHALVHHLWRFGIGTSSDYVVGVNGPAYIFRRFKLLYDRLVPTVVIEGNP